MWTTRVVYLKLNLEEEELRADILAAIMGPPIMEGEYG